MEAAVQEVGSSNTVSKSVAVTACTSMALFYVAILYFPTLILRLPPPTSYKSFMVRRFICAAISSLVSLLASSLILPVKKWDISHVMQVFGLRLDHFWEAMLVPLCLTSLMYAGSLVLKFWSLISFCEQHSVRSSFQEFVGWVCAKACNVSSWRNYLVAPLTEELVFRACMIPLLLCGGFSTYSVIFLCPIFFSLAHLNHFLEFYAKQNCSLVKASAAAGFQLGYTVIFGSYASFLFVRTGHLTAPLAAHIFCNSMGLPAIISKKTGIVCVAFVAGILAFFNLLFPLSSPHLYNDRTDNCNCWHRYCSWS